MLSVGVTLSGSLQGHCECENQEVSHYLEYTNKNTIFSLEIKGFSENLYMDKVAWNVWKDGNENLYVFCSNQPSGSASSTEKKNMTK